MEEERASDRSKSSGSGSSEGRSQSVPPNYNLALQMSQVDLKPEDTVDTTVPEKLSEL